DSPRRLRTEGDKEPICVSCSSYDSVAEAVGGSIAAQNSIIVQVSPPPSLHLPDIQRSPDHGSTTSGHLEGETAAGWTPAEVNLRSPAVADSPHPFAGLRKTRRGSMSARGRRPGRARRGRPGRKPSAIRRERPSRPR